MKLGILTILYMTTPHKLVLALSAVLRGNAVCDIYSYFYTVFILINILKIRKLKYVGGGRSTIAVETITVEAIAVEAIAVHPGGGQSTITVETIAVEAIAVHPGGSINDHCWGNHCSSWGGQSMIAVEVIAVEMITVEAIAVEVIAIEAITVHLGGGGVDQQSLLRQSLLRQSLLRRSLLKRLLLKQLLLRGSTENCIMGIVRCIMGNAFCSTTDLQVPSVCTSFVKFGIYWEKNKEDRLVHNHEISVPPRHSVRSTGWPLVPIKYWLKFRLNILIFLIIAHSAIIMEIQ